MRLSNLFPASKTLAGSGKPKTDATATLNDVVKKKKRPGEFDIRYPEMPKQQVKDYKVIKTKQELVEYALRCQETGLGGFDYETSGDENHRIPPVDDEGKALNEKAMDKWLKDVNLDPHKSNVCSMSLAAAPHEARAIFIDNPGSRQFEPGLSRTEARKVMFDTLEEFFFTNNKIMKIAVNLNFEEKHTAKNGKYILMPVADPFIMWIRLQQLIAPNKIKNPKRPYTGKGLKPMTFETFGVKMNEFTDVLKKNNAIFFDQVSSDSQDSVSYCCEDSDYAVQHYLYWDEIAKQIPNDNPIYPTYSDWLHNIEMPFTRVTGLMEYHGMYWDTDTASVKREEAENAIEAAGNRIASIAKDNFNIDLNIGKSGKTGDVRYFIFDTLRLPVAGRTEKKEPSLDGNAMLDMIFMLENKLIDLDEEKYLEEDLPEGWETLDPETDTTLTKSMRGRIRIAHREPHQYKDLGIELLEQLRNIQKFSTVLSSHLEGREKYLNPVTGRIHAQFQPWTETARLSSSNPNGQNVPRPDNDKLGVRNLYRAAPGKVMFLIDESGFELRLTAWKSNCPVMIPAFLNKEDLHRKTASTMTGKPESEITKHERSGAKAGNFGSVYGGTEYALQGTFKKLEIRKSLPECKKIVDAVLATYPGIPNYQRASVLEAREKGYSETIFGFKRLLPNINSANRYTRGEDERRSQNTPIQGSAADIMKLAQNKVYDRIGLDTYKSALLNKYGPNDEATAWIQDEPLLSHGHVDMIAQIHDEIIFEIDDDPKLVEATANYVKATMELSPIPGFPIPLEAECSMAYSWGNKVSLESWLVEKEKRHEER